MSILMAVLMATASGNSLSIAPQVQAQERVVLQQAGAPSPGANQPYSIREQGARELEGFMGGKYIVFADGYDFVLLAAIVVLVVVLIIVL